MYTITDEICYALSCRFVVGGSIEENVHQLGQQRAAAMDLSAAAVKRGASAKERGGLTIR